MDFFLFEECVLFYLANSWPKTVGIKQKFIHWATRGRLNNHCNNKDLLGIKQQSVATGFLHTSGIQAWSAIFSSMQSLELYVYGYTHNWMANQPMFKRTGYSDLGPSYGPFSKGTVYVNSLHVFLCLFSRSLNSWCVLSWYFYIRVNSYASF